MKYKELFQLKNELENINIDYNSLQEKLISIKERLYKEYSIDDNTTNEEITKYIHNEVEKLKDTTFYNHTIYVIKSCAFSVLINLFVSILSLNINISLPIFMMLIGGNVMWYVISIRVHDYLTNNKCDEDITTIKEDIESLISDRQEVINELAITKEKQLALASNYEKLVKKLNNKEYREYLESIVSYLFTVVNKKDKELEEIPTTNNNYTLHLN